MATNYAAIRADNERKYGTDVGRYGRELLANRYDERTHFIFELLQNAEDAFKKRSNWEGQRSVEFKVSEHELRVSHFGKPFDEADVRGICGILESTKDLTSIGRFGIGFKSVYAFTACPEVHSGDEHFAIDSYVWPEAIPVIETRPGETVFRLPLRADDTDASQEIISGLQRLEPRSLLFLREIQEISWSADHGPSGLYLRTTPKLLSSNARKVVVIGEDHATAGVLQEEWLVFSREVTFPDGGTVGAVEVAFKLVESESVGEQSVRSLSDSPLVAFFPTIFSTKLGFLIQGPYRTTPSRDNIPIRDPWNQYLVKQTASLLKESLTELRDLGLMNVAALRSLPLDPANFPEDSMLFPLFDAVRETLRSEPLLPRFGGGHGSAQQAKLARTQELREIFNSAQLSALFQTDQELTWLSEDITQDRTPDLRSYLMGELEIAEVEPQTLLPGLTKSFLETQTDDWIVRLYGFLHGQQALLRRMTNVPLIRLEDGSHVTPRRDTQPQAFLPGERVTGFPTVRRSVCQTEAALAFLKGLGLTEPDTVDDVIANVIPKYQQSGVQVKLTQYQADIERMVAAFSTDSTAQRIKLVAALRSSKFVFATDCANGNRHLYQPTEVYQATQRLKDLFRGVPSVMIVDDSFDCLRGEDIRDLLEACGAALYLQPVETESAFTWQEKVEMRRKAGREDISYEVGVQDFALRGLETLLDMFAQLTSEEAQARSRLLWEALCDVQDRRGTSVFSGIYHWFYVSPRRTTFDASFVRLLNEGAWVPDVKGDLQPPRLVVFEDIDPRLEANPFLLTKIHYKPPAIAQLAKEAGFEPGMLDLLKKYGLTSEAQMREILNVTDCPPETDGQSRHDELTPEEATRKLLESLPEPTPPAPSPPENPVVPTINGGNGAPHRGGPNSHPEGHGGIGGNGGRPRENGHPISNPAGGSRKFVSYVSVDPNDDGPDPDGLNHQERMALEEEGIKLIQSLEPELQCTPKNNPGFDLTQQGSDGHPVKWVEVKAMKGTFYDRPVGLSSKQFGCAQQHGEAYWLYIVQLAGSPENARIVRIQDPAGKARTFTFDHGWTAVAEITEPAESLRQE